jgi:hypothetical protein
MTGIRNFFGLVIVVAVLAIAGTAMHNVTSAGSPPKHSAKDVLLEVRWTGPVPIVISRDGPETGTIRPIQVNANEEGNGLWSNKLPYVSGASYFLFASTGPNTAAILQINSESDTGSIIVCGPKAIPPNGDAECRWTAP